MAKCCQCGKEIPRGRKYKSQTLSSLYFCSEKCYIDRVNNPPPPKEKYEGLVALRDYINSQWEPNSINWTQTTKMIKNLCEKENMTCPFIQGLLEYAIEIEEKKPDSRYGIGQYIWKYYDSYCKYLALIDMNNKEKDVPVKVKPIKMKPHKQGQKNNRLRKEGEWNDAL